jgi:TrmH family RNA methyltransferase
MLSKTYIKYIQSLHHKKFRDEEGLFLAEGFKVVSDILSAGKFVCKSIIITPNELPEVELALLKSFDTEIIEAQDFELAKISTLTTPNKVLAVFSKSEMQSVSPKGKISLLLDSIQDPGNMGTIIRIADWFGIENIVCSRHCAEIYNPKVVQSTMGSIARVNIFYTDVVEWLQNNKGIVKTYAATLQGKNLFEIDPISEGIILIGNESKGINDNLIQLADYKVTIPKYGNAESLNAAVATGILVSHFIR